ncbi:uncharacterized protein LOC131831520 [Mustela lutreola]|uniref:uncharacterized protein LOC131831520 n=1 Tax=Mustela lutreola TaxID=9666 RepID=UPI00279729D2|nr:uncharacterized protein LOC131831520 [Mustela lutreola]
MGLPSDGPAFPGRGPSTSSPYPSGPGRPLCPPCRLSWDVSGAKLPCSGLRHHLLGAKTAFRIGVSGTGKAPPASKVHGVTGLDFVTSDYSCRLDLPRRLPASSSPRRERRLRSSALALEAPGGQERRAHPAQAEHSPAPPGGPRDPGRPEIRRQRENDLSGPHQRALPPAESGPGRRLSSLEMDWGQCQAPHSLSRTCQAGGGEALPSNGALHASRVGRQSPGEGTSVWRTAGAGAPLSHQHLLWPWGVMGAGQTARSSRSYGCSSGKGSGSSSRCSRGFRAKAAPTWLHQQRRHPQRSASGIWDGFYFIYLFFYKFQCFLQRTCKAYKCYFLKWFDFPALSPVE